jgi:hypothetical protein
LDIATSTGSPPSQAELRQKASSRGKKTYEQAVQRVPSSE